MNDEIKGGIVFICIIISIFSTIFGIISIIEYNKISVENDFLKERIKEQKTLINYLKGSDK